MQNIPEFVPESVDTTVVQTKKYLREYITTPVDNNNKIKHKDARIQYESERNNFYLLLIDKFTAALKTPNNFYRIELGSTIHDRMYAYCCINSAQHEAVYNFMNELTKKKYTNNHVTWSKTYGTVTYNHTRHYYGIEIQLK